LNDVIIIGGSYAGIAAALQLARARRRIAVVDTGRRRNRFASHSHGFLGQDGRAPGDIVADAKRQLLAYPTVEWIDGEAVSAEGVIDAFHVDLADGRRLAARRLILAVGVSDTLPQVEGLAERWGQTVFHCPYCHGYELGGAPIAVLASHPMSVHQALLVADWGPLTLLLNGAAEPEEHECRQLAARGVTIEAAPVDGVAGDRTIDVRLADGRSLAFAGLFVASRTAPIGGLAEALGCAMEEGPLGPFIAADAMRTTSVPGIYACGDASRAAGSVTLAVGDGAMAGVAAHRSLIFDPLEAL
jgi:thioredoxin reductase